ncbi:hypothetical protein YC2023_033212 [Brassica napus]
MTHESEDCLKSISLQEASRETVARGRLTFKQDGGSQVSEEKSKPFRERASSYSRVQRSTYSLRAKRDSKHNDTQYKPYAYIRNQTCEGNNQ